MKRFILFLLICMAAQGYPATNYIFDADYDNDTLRASFATTDASQTNELMQKVTKKGVEKYYYRVVVTEPQYTAGWPALDPAIKTAAKEAASEQYDDFENWDSKEGAIIEAIRDYLNVLNATNGLPEIKKSDMKQKIKDKKPKKK